MLELHLKHLQAQVLIQYLATLGLHRLVSEKDSSATLDWMKDFGGHYPILRTDLALEEVGRILMEDMSWWRDSRLLDLSIKTLDGASGFKQRMPRSILRYHVLQHGVDSTYSQFLLALASEASEDPGPVCLVKDEACDPSIELTRWCKKHPLDLTGKCAQLYPQAKKLVEDMLFPNLETAQQRMLLWLQGKDYLHLGWEIKKGKKAGLPQYKAVASLHHIHAEDVGTANQSGMVVEMDPLTEWFGMFHSLPLFPGVQRQGRLVTSALEEDGRSRHWFCPVWNGKLTAPHVAFLVRMSFVNMSLSEREIRGISAVYKSRRFLRNKRLIFLWATPHSPAS